MKKFSSKILLILTLTVTFIAFVSSNVKADDKLSKSKARVLSDSVDGIKSVDILKIYLNNQIEIAWTQWQKNFEERKSVEDIEQHYIKLKKKFITSIGELPDRTPLNPRVTGIIKKNGYRIEKVIIESRPNFYITAALFIPESNLFTAPYPGVLIPSGHYENAKAHVEYQSMGALCALGGMVALVFDPIGQGERLQIFEDDGKSKLWGTRSHNLSGISAILLGQNIAHHFIWDGIRALDYLTSRPEINPQLIGITGNSGGATQASYIFMLDERIKVAAPSCYIHNLNAQASNALGDAEQNIFSQVQFGLDHPDYIMSRGPAPVKILAATHDFFIAEAVWESFRYIKRFYTRLGYSERVDILENDAGHNYNKTQREGAARWLARWLLKNDNIIIEPEIELLTNEEMLCTPKGQVLLLEGARSVQDIHLELADELGSSRKDFLSNNRDVINKAIMKLLRVDDLDEMESLQSITTGTIEKDLYKIEKLILTNKIGLKLPALKFTPHVQNEKNPVLLISQYGKSHHLQEIDELVKSGTTVLAVDLYGTGETKQEGRSGFRLSENINWEDCFKAYLLGQSIVGMRVEDIIQCSQYLLNTNNTLSSRIDLIAIGEVGVPALHAAFLKPELFSNTKLSNSLISWHSVIENTKSFNQLPNAVHGALKYYDLPDLVKMLGRKVTIEEPLDATGLPFGKQSNQIEYSVKPKYEGLVGILYGKVNFSNPESPDPIDNLDCYWHNKSQKRGRDWASIWKGYLISPYDGEVEITIYSNQKVELELAEILNETLDYNNEKKTIKVNLEMGKTYPLQIKYSQDGVDESHMKITWNWTGQPEETISSEYLRYSAAQKFKMENDWK